MAGPVVFVSTHAIKEGKLDAFRRYYDNGAPSIEADKPKTLLFYAFLDDEGTEVNIVHVFPDADAMDRHFEGAAERAAAAYELLEPKSFEVYGSASEDAIGMLRQGAEAAGVALTVKPESLGGFLRLGSSLSEGEAT